jgi:hypothetical protein
LRNEALSSVSISLTAPSLNILAGSLWLTGRPHTMSMERNADE